MTPSANDWTAFYDQLRRFVAARVSVSSDVDDLVQMILERAIAKSGVSEIESSVGWLFGIARNAIADHYRGQARFLTQAADALDDLSDTLGHTEDERAEVVRCMEPLLSAVAPDVAQLLRWADMQGRSMQEISVELDISMTAAKSRVRRARRDFIEAARACCVVTVDARSRVTDLTPRAPCAAPCRSCAPAGERRG